MKYFPCEEIAGPTADVSEALRFCEVGLLPPQLLRQQLLLGDVDGAPAKTFENSLFNDGNSHAANVAQLPVGPNNSLGYVAARVLLIHDLNRFSHRGSVFWMNEGQILLNRWDAVFRVQPKNFVQFVGPIGT